MPLIQLNRLDAEENSGNNRNRDSQVDIVAVHGLNENSTEEAWTDPETNVLWLRDLLPDAIPAARVLVYSYNADLTSLNGSGSAERIQQHAHILVADLQADRALEGCSQRPIIFICHGLGGIVVKRALTFASTKTSPQMEHLYSIFLSSFGILFFGTPHAGSEEESWAAHTTAKVSRRLFRRREENQVVSAHGNESKTFQLISEQFVPLIKHFHIFFFWEQAESDLGDRYGYVVEEFSAAPLVDNTERAGIHATHSRMVKLTKSHPSYRTVLEAIVRYSRNGPRVISRRWRQASASLSRARSDAAFDLTGTAFDVHNDNQPFQYQGRPTDKSGNKYFHIPQAVSSIFTGREDISEEVDLAFFSSNDSDFLRQQRRYIIYGIGGSGKTQFACKFAQTHREKFWVVFWIDATSPETANYSFAKIGKIGGLEPTASAGRYWLSHLEDPWLLIINNCDAPDQDLQELFPEGERGNILVTTTNPGFRVQATVGSVEFTGLQEKEAVMLLLRAADIPRPWDTATEEAGSKIADALGYLALALIQAGSLILQGICGLKDFLNFYNEHRRQLGIPHMPNNEHHGRMVYSTWDLSVHSLEKQRREASRDAAQLLNIVSSFHFEHIRVDIFTRALSNRSRTSDGSEKKSFSQKLRSTILARLVPPLALPEFLRQEAWKLSPYRVRRALHELRSFSLITYDGKNDSFSLHPVVHAWARDRLTAGEQALWAHIALNTLMESISLPSATGGESPEAYHRDILPHLDVCLAACPIQNLDYEAKFGKSKSPLKLAWNYVPLLAFRSEVFKAAKCGYVFAERGRFNDAVRYLSMVKTALVQSRGYENEWTMKAMLALAGTYWGLGRLEEACALQQRVVESRKSVYGLEHSETLSAMDQLGRSYWLHGQYHESLELQTVTTGTMETALGADHPSTLAAMDNLGVTLGSWHRYHESMEVHSQVLACREKSLGSKHADTLMTMNNLAMALLDLGRLVESKEWISKVYEERRMQLGKEHPWTLWALCNLAKVELERGFLDDAENMLVPGIEAAKRSLGDNHLGVLMGCGELALVFARQGRLAEALKLTHETISRLEQSRGLEHPDTVYALFKLAQLHELQGKPDDAITVCETAMLRVEMRLTRQHPLGKQIEAYLGKLEDSQQYELEKRG